MSFTTYSQIKTQNTFKFPEPPRNLNARRTYNQLRDILGLPEKAYKAPKTAREILEAHEKEKKKEKEKLN